MYGSVDSIEHDFLKGGNMTADFDLQSLLSNPPKLHEHEGALISDWRIDDRTCLELRNLLGPGMKTLETGGGLRQLSLPPAGAIIHA